MGVKIAVDNVLKINISDGFDYLNRPIIQIHLISRKTSM
jgi:hypothetical protein